MKVMLPFSFKCSKCDKIHEGIPSFNFAAPLHYYAINKEERSERTFLTSDTCVIDDDAFYGKGFFEIPINGLEEVLSFSAWVSLSEANFLIFQDLWEISDASLQKPMFGWFSSDIYGFGDCINLKTNLVFQDNNNRPIIDFEPTDHPLSIAVRKGVSKDKMIEIVEHCIHIWQQNLAED